MNERSNQDPDSPSRDGEENDSDYTTRILKGSSSVFTGSIVGKVVGFLLQLVLTRGLGTALFGMYSYGLTVLRLTREVGTLGLQNGVVRFAAAHHEANEPAKVKGTFLAVGGLGLAAGVVLGVGLFFVSPWLAEGLFQNPGYTRVFQIFACGLPFYVLTYLASRMARALGRMEIDVLLSSILQPTLFLLLVSGLFLLGLGLTAALYAFLASTILAAGASIYGIYRLFPPLRSSLAAEVNIRSLLRFSLPIVGVSLASIGLTYTDRIMLGIFSSEDAVGIYQAASQMSAQLRFILFAITASFSPIISELYHNQKSESLAQLYADTVRWIVMGTLPLAIVLVAYAPEIMSIFGPGFRQGDIVLRILSLSYLIVVGSGSVGHMLQMSDHQDFVLAVNTFSALLNIGLNWIFIQWYGVTGAALATGITQALSNVIQLTGLYQFISIQPFRWNLWKPISAAILTSLAVWGLYVALSSPARWIIGIPAALLIYAGLTFALGLSPGDRSLLQNIWDQIRARIAR